MIKDFLNKYLANINSFLSNQDAYTKKFYIRKRNNTKREIISPRGNYKRILSELNIELQKFYAPPEFVHGFINERNIKTNAESHLSKLKILKIDLLNFFNTISTKMIYELFERPYFNIDQQDAQLLASFCSVKNHLPQGFPTSPVLSNLIFNDLDIELNKIAQEHSLTYTRYADDLIFSSLNKEIGSQIFNYITEIITKGGFYINYEKVKYKGKHRCQIITGIVVNNKLSVKRSYKRNIRAILNNWEIFGYNSTSHEYLENYSKDKLNFSGQFIYSLKGKIEFVGFICGKDDIHYNKFLSKFSELIKRDHAYIDNQKEQKYYEKQMMILMNNKK